MEEKLEISKFIKLDSFTREEKEDHYIIKGYGAKWDEVDFDEDYFVKGAFEESILQMGHPAFCHQHNFRDLLGVFDVVKEDNIGLYIEGKIPKGTEDLNKIVKLIKLGAYGGFSVGGMKEKQIWDETRKAWRIEKAKLIEISLVTKGAQAGAKIIDIKSLKDGNPREIEKALKDGTFKFSNNAAKAVANFLVKDFSDCESQNKTNKSREDFSKILSNISKDLETIKTK